jgi:putative AdoMet-dependent methyltransferase
MESLHVNEFNHDNWATDYDEDVSDENNPIRAGYSKLLDWVILCAEIDNQKEILELGSGSGNLTKRIQKCKRLLCVDISTKMEVLSVPKTTHLQRREFRQSDILKLFEEDIGSFDVVVSTYTIHHLLEAEKNQLFSNILRVLNAGGAAVFGDLMFENESTKNDIIRKFRKSEYKDIADDIEAEFFWDIERSIKELESLGFNTKVKRFSELSFGITARKAEEK